MGMYIGNGLIVHAPSSSTVVRIVEIDHGNVYYRAGAILR
jgi:peptidoglycan DL-endopeptidase CwlO